MVCLYVPTPVTPQGLLSIYDCIFENQPFMHIS